MENTLISSTPYRLARLEPPGWRLLGWLSLVLAVLLGLTNVAQAQVTTLSYTGSPQTYVVPAGITQLKVVARGGAGSYNGAQVTAILTVTPGETLTAVVGGLGQYDATSNSGGYNGGGNGGPGGDNGGGGGGGATDLRRASANGSTGDYLTTRNALVVAGGAGGGGYDESGGAAGTPVGGNGPNGGGNGGTASAAGTGTLSGANGVANVGGAAQNAAGGGGGGGGGYYGGGGSGSGSGSGYGGGGGSSFVTATGSSNISYAIATSYADGSITLSPIVPGLAVTSVSPTSGVRGASVTITGTGFTGATGVSFGSTAASSFTVNSGTQITAVVANTTPFGSREVAVTNASGTSSGTVAFTVVQPATIGTSAPSVSGTNATLGGNVFNDNGATVTERGVVYSTSSNPPTLADTKVVIGSGTGAFSQVVSGLAATTLYYVRAYATNSNGTGYGALATFTTGATSPPAATITSLSPMNGPVGTSVSITGTGFLLGGNNVRFNGVLISAGSTNSTTSITAVVPAGATTGNVTVQNSNGTSTTSAATFFTVNAAPSVPTVTTTTPATGVGYNGATVGGNVTNDGGFTVTGRGVTYSTATLTPTVGTDPSVASGSGTGAFSAAITGLMPNFTYYYRAYATSSAGTSYGALGSFTTPALPANLPTVSSLSPGNGTVGTSVSIGGSNFVAGGSTVTFNGTAATSFTVNSASSITAVVPAGATSGFVNVTTSVGTSQNGLSFNVTSVPTLTTAAATAITNLTATLGGNVTADGGTGVSERGVVYSSTDPLPTINSGTKVQMGSGTGTFAQSVTGLTAYTVYYVRAYAFNNVGTGYGPMVQFRTDPTPPTLTSLNPTTGPVGTSVTLTGADFLSGSTVSFGGTAATGVTVNSLTSITAVVPASLPVGSVSVTVTTAGGTTSGQPFNVTALPTVTTDTPSSLTTTGAALGGNVTATGGLSVTERGVVYSTSNATPTTADTKLPMGSGAGSFSQNVTGLTSNTTYYVRAYAINALGTSYGAVQTFSPLGAPVVTTAVPTNVLSTSATLGGILTSDGGSTVTSRGVLYVQGTGTPTFGDNSALEYVGTTGSYSFNITALLPGTQYTVRAFAVNSLGTRYGALISFTTTTTATVTTTAPTNITRYGATLGGNVTVDGGTAVTERGVVYSTSNATPTTADTKLAIGTGTGSFAQSLTNLPMGTLYYVRAYATNDVGTSYGAVQQFTVQDAPVYWPLALNGFNADVVVRADNYLAPQTETNATVDGASPGYVFYERGYEGTSSPNGLPVGGRFTSAVTSNLPYQLRPYSNANNALRLVPGASGVFTLSSNAVVMKKLYVLATSGGGASTITVAMDFANGATQTVTGLAVPDWYGGANAALAGIGRVQRTSTQNQSPDNSSAGNPRLYEIPVNLPIAAYEDLPLIQITITNAAGSGVVSVMAITAELTPTILSAGTNTFNDVIQLFTVAPGTAVQAEGWGGGGSGNFGPSSGGGGGAYTTTSLTGNNNYIVNPGPGGGAGMSAADGTASVVTTGAGTAVLRADYGRIGATLGCCALPGGSGGSASASLPSSGAVSGNNGGGASGSTSGAGGAAAGPGGGAGGTAGFAGVGGGNGSAPGGGGGGGGGGFYAGGAGGTGRIVLTPLVIPTLTSLSPTSGPTGTTVTLTGTDFTNVSTVSFGGTAATVTYGSSTSLTAPVPASLGLGVVSVTVTTVGGTSNGVNFTVTTAPAISAPTVTTTTPATINPTFATLGGNVTATGGATVTERGVVYSSTATVPTTANSKETIGSGTGAFSQIVTGLTASTLYYVRAYAINSAGTSYGAVQQFTTLASTTVATVTTATPATITTTGATLGGNVTADGGASVTERGVVYSSTATAPTTANSKTQIGSGTGSFSQAVTGLTASTLYYVRAYAINSVGTSYGATQSFTTTAAAILATVTTATPTTITTTGATLGGNVTADGGTSVTERGVVYVAGSGTPTTANTKVTIGSGTGSFAQAVTGLSASTSYTVRAYAINSVGTSYGSAVSFTTSAGAAPDLTISTGNSASPISIAAGTYNDVTITGTGFAIMSGAVVVNGAMAVNGSLMTNCQALTGAGSFTLAAGGTLGICDAAGISSTGTTGAVKTSGTRAFSTDASYVYNGTTVQGTGNGLPARVRNLTTTNNNRVDVNASTSVAQVLTVAGSGNFDLDGPTLTLLSDATGTALAVNAGTGVVSGFGATMQRYIDPSRNPGLGYRHFTSPVNGNTLTDLTTAGFTPVFNAAFNSSSNPAGVQPFPTVQGYNQARLATAVNNLGAFDKGWFSPLATDGFVPGVGYTVSIPASAKVDFVGYLNTGDYTRTLARNSGTTAADAGWQLVGNPYPAPIDWSLVAPADRTGLDASMYVFESTAAYSGTYRAYVNGVGGNPLIGSAQGFWVRVSNGQTSGSLAFHNAQRKTSFADQTPVRRGAADSRPTLQLALAGNGATDNLYVYAEAGATAGLDGAFDAAKLANPTGLNLASLTAAGEQLAIDGRPAFGTSIPLFVGVPATGSYAFAAATLANLSGTRVTLVDNLTGTRTALTAGATYRFTMTGYTAPGRFWLNMAPAGALATAAAALEAQVLAYPTPAHGTLTVLRPAATTTTGVLVNSLGQTVRHLALPTAETTVDLTGLASGVYSLRLTLDGQPVTKRVVLD